MDNKYFKTNWVTQYDAKMTFAGILLKHFDAIAAKNRWGSETKAQYARNYEDNLLPRLQGRAMSEYTAEDFEQVIYSLSTEKSYKHSTLQHYRRLIKHVIAFGVQYEGLTDPLWGMYFSEILVPKDVVQREDITLPRSLDPVMIWKIASMIYATALDSGARAGLALMLESGLRPKEAAAVTYNDFTSPAQGENIPKVFIHNSTIGQSRNLRAGVKTDNGYRPAIISDTLASLLDEKKKRTENLTTQKTIASAPCSSDIGRLPIVHDKNNPSRHCSSSQLTVEFRNILAQTGYDQREFQLLQNVVNSQDFLEEIRRITPKELGFADERDPSAYACRRHYNTDMHILGMSPEDRQFCMGHKIENPSVKRSDYANEDLLRRVAKLLAMRPYTNPSVLDCKTITSDYYEGDVGYNQNFAIPNRKGTMIIEFFGYDLLDPGKISVIATEGTFISGRVYTQPLNAPVGQSPNVLYDYLELHRRAREQAQTEQDGGLENKTDPQPQNK